MTRRIRRKDTDALFLQLRGDGDTHCSPLSPFPVFGRNYGLPGPPAHPRKSRGPFWWGEGGKIDDKGGITLKNRGRNGVRPRGGFLEALNGFHDFFFFFRFISLIQIYLSIIIIII